MHKKTKQTERAAAHARARDVIGVSAGLAKFADGLSRDHWRALPPDEREAWLLWLQSTLQRLEGPTERLRLFSAGVRVEAVH